MNLPKCTRCGICCISGECEFGSLDSEGFCKYIEFHLLEAHCVLIDQHAILKQDVGVGKGCVLKACPEAYEMYREQYKDFALHRKTSCGVA